PMNGQDLIDQFLEKSANNDPQVRMKPVGVRPVDEVAFEEVAALEQMVSSFNLPEDSFTDTLARIYLKQKRYDRALEIFKGLSLKYPEKNVYFADQIRFLEKLIHQLKK
ncbi:MAG: tetratricopeptide repeat protein, partial [Bacteroidia bacterium]|nr:tetratricopeptide repeat protein [Bacteroidia bacterium]